MSGHLSEWQTLFARYGLEAWADDTWADKRPWAQRHDSTAPRNTAPRLTCACRTQTGTECALKATQEDGLCDECREWCWAVDSDGTEHRLVSLRR